MNWSLVTFWLICVAGAVAFHKFASDWERKYYLKRGESKPASGLLDSIAAVVISLLWPALCAVAVAWWFVAKWLRRFNCRD